MHYRIYQVSATKLTEKDIPQDLYNLSEQDQAQTTFDYFGEKIRKEYEASSLECLPATFGGLATYDEKERCLRFAPKEEIRQKIKDILTHIAEPALEALEQHGWIDLHKIKSQLFNINEDYDLFYDAENDYTQNGFEILDDVLSGKYDNGMYIGGIYDAHR